MVDSQLVFLLQIVLSLIVYTLVARWYLSPVLARLPLVQALTPLLLFHATRYIGATFLTPSVIDARVPVSFTVPGAVGDLLAVLLALIALAALRTDSRFALPLLWVFNLEGTLDFVFAFVQGVRVGLPYYQLGAAWLIPTMLVPAYLVVHILIFRMLLTRARELRGPERVVKGGEGYEP